MSSHVELKDITDNLSTYFKQLSDYLDDAGNPCPSFEDFVDLLTYDQILTEAVQNERGSANYSSGAKTDIIYLVAAITREFGMRGRTKANYYTDGPLDPGITSEMYTALYGKYLNYFRGTAPEQGVN